MQQANLSVEQAEIIAEADYITKPELGALAELRFDLRTDLAKLKNELRFDVQTDLARLKNELVPWIVGSVAIGVLINHFWK